MTPIFANRLGQQRRTLQTGTGSVNFPIPASPASPAKAALPPPTGIFRALGKMNNRNPQTGPAQDSMAKSSPILQALQKPRAFNSPTQANLGNTQYTNLATPKPAATATQAGNPSPARMTPAATRAASPIGSALAAASGNPAAPPTAAAPANPIAQRLQQTTNGFSSFLDDKLGSAGLKKSGSDRKAGWVVQSGPFKGKTRDEAAAQLRQQYAAMSPEQKAAYEARSRNEDIGDSAPPTGPAAQSGAAIPDPTAPMDPMSDEDSDDDPTLSAAKRKSLFDDDEDD